MKYEKISEFLSENFHFLVVKISVYLNRHVFVMTSDVLLYVVWPAEMDKKETKRRRETKIKHK